MIDLKFLRENPDLVKENIKKKFQDHKLPLVDEVIEYDKKAREAQQEADDLRAKKKLSVRTVTRSPKRSAPAWHRARRKRLRL